MTRRYARLLVALVLCTFAFATTYRIGAAFAAQDQDHVAEPQHAVSPDSPDTHPDEKPNANPYDKEHDTTGHEKAHHGPEEINWSDVWDPHRPAYVALLINFGVLVFAYYLIGRKPISNALKQRRVTIGKAIEDAQGMLGEAKERAKKYQADLKNADTDAADAKAALIASGKGELEKLLSEANEKAERMKRDADRLVEQERKQLQHDLLLETIELSVREAAKSLEKSVTAEDHARLADDLLAELSRKSAPSAQPGGAS